MWTEETSGTIGVAVLMDGQQVGEAVIWSNANEVHRAVVPVFIPITLDAPWPSPTEPPTYSFELAPLNAETVSDQNDWYQLSLVY